jgi:hypothetical protein
MRSRGWLDESRVWKSGTSSTNVTVDLRPLHRRDLGGYLAIDFLGGYLVEYRKKERWDGGFSHSAVFLHRFDDNHSYVMAGTKGNFDLVAGDKFEYGDPNSFDIFSSYGRIEVVSIDDANSTAKIQVVHRQPRAIPQIYGTLVGGVANDGGGWIIVNGHLIRIPPWDPLFPVVQQLGAYRQAESIVDISVRRSAQQSALQSVTRHMSTLHTSLNPYRVPGAAMGKDTR